MDPKWSQDGKKLAYVRYSSDEVWELHVIAVSDRENRVLFSDPDKKIFELAGWSPDSKKNYVSINNVDRSFLIGAVHWRMVPLEKSSALQMKDRFL